MKMDKLFSKVNRDIEDDILHKLFMLEGIKSGSVGEALNKGVIMKETTFEKNGGYFIGGVHTWIVKSQVNLLRMLVRIVKRSLVVSLNLTGLLHKKFSDVSKPSYQPTGRPSGWHFMNEFVDKDGTVYHKGKEQPKLKGTLPPTKVKPVKKKKPNVELRNRFFWIQKQ